MDNGKKLVKVRKNLILQIGRSPITSQKKQDSIAIFWGKIRGKIAGKIYNCLGARG